MNRRGTLIVSAVALAVAAWGAWYWLSGTPKYSLYCLRRAIDRQDLETAERYYDEAAVAERFRTDFEKDIAKGEKEGRLTQRGMEEVPEIMRTLDYKSISDRNIRWGTPKHFRAKLKSTGTWHNFADVPIFVADEKAPGKMRVLQYYRMIQMKDRRWKIVDYYGPKEKANQGNARPD